MPFQTDIGRYWSQYQYSFLVFFETDIANSIKADAIYWCIAQHYKELIYKSDYQSVNKQLAPGLNVRHHTLCLIKASLTKHCQSWLQLLCWQKFIRKQRKPTPQLFFCIETGLGLLALLGVPFLSSVCFIKRNLTLKSLGTWRGPVVLTLHTSQLRYKYWSW